ncbi:NAD(P)H steroid dehydrogenase-like protein [Piscinibacter sakaiensis]|uniref:NAD(P)H steroid dehydrogenase-like protein n=1 Tax=Piscinibacter sakaiensis TaxID=1547922 RepID=A0A0K8P6H8_PISS1|nr:NAD(P)H steroid dehydrogenase-like protein [Piscinibacter sakaiensis]
MLVTGGSGFVGGRLIERLRSDGWTVRALARSGAARARVAACGAEPVDGDLDDEAALERAVRGCDAVVHGAALFTLWGRPADFEQANVQGTRRLLAAARRAGTVRRFVQIGAAAVVMGDMAAMLRVNEALPRQQRPWAPYSASKARSEALVLDASEPGRFETVVLRPPMIWGRGMPMLDHLVATVGRGQFRWVGDGSQAMSTAHVDNVCHAAVLALTHGPGGQAYFVSDGRDGTLREVLSAFLATRGVAPPRASAPWPLAWALAAAMEWVWRRLDRPGEPPLTRQMLRLIGRPFTLDIAKAERELGYRPVVSWEQGLAAMRRP